MTQKPLAQAGLAAKGTVYAILGILTFMAAFHINGESSNKADKSGVFDFIGDQSGGKIIIAIIAAGLLCYTIWRFTQALADKEHNGSDAKGLAKRSRYFLSGLIYGYIAFQAGCLVFSDNSGSGDNFQKGAQTLLSKPFGQWLVGIAAAIFAGIGIYQIYYALSEKYKKHVESAGSADGRKWLLGAGKVGYVARGLVWMLISWLLFKAALHANSSEAGDTSKVFRYIEDSPFGTYILAAIGIGLFCYGFFNFVRAKFENFD